jgi:hypothetical protein
MAEQLTFRRQPTGLKQNAYLLCHRELVTLEPKWLQIPIWYIIMFFLFLFSPGSCGWMRVHQMNNMVSETVIERFYVVILFIIFKNMVIKKNSMCMYI